MNLKTVLPLLLVCVLPYGYANECNLECKETEYTSYVECIQNRMKRSADCGYSDCETCDCDFCVVNSCPEKCLECCKNTQPCTTRGCCHKTCHSRCKSISCRTDCRKSCAEKLISEGFNITSAIGPRHNVTTVINIRNTINNTNVIDIPVAVNSTTFNNLTVGFSGDEYDNEDEVEEDDEEDEEEDVVEEEDNCCYVYGPKKCSKSNTYPYTKCVQYRKNVCGPVCVAPIIHEQPVRRCLRNLGGMLCQDRTAYIPQPRPRCSYQNVWPYVACGAPPNQFCGGCYEHYNSQQIPEGCSQTCYDDGYGIGPYYRKGPFYRPGYSHVPSCYQIGTCTFISNHNNPTYGSPSYPPNSYQPNVIVYPKPPVHPNFNNTNSTSNNGYFNIAMFPPHIVSGYPYPPSPPIYILPPEVDIQAIITHPEKESRYAQITITKSEHEDEMLHTNDL